MLSISEAMLKTQAERVRKDSTVKKILYNKDGTPKSMITILEELQREAVCNVDTTNKKEVV